MRQRGEICVIFAYIEIRGAYSRKWDSHVTLDISSIGSNCLMARDVCDLVSHLASNEHRYATPADWAGDC